MKPIIVLVGRPNVGKSTLFNRLTRARNALVANEPGLTRDRQYGVGSNDNKSFIVVDTAGIADVETAEKKGRSLNKNLTEIVSIQTLQAIQEADIVLFMVDARQGIHPFDKVVAKVLRALTVPVKILVNKAEGINYGIAVADFYELGFDEPFAISASHGDGVSDMIQKVLLKYPEDLDSVEVNNELVPCISVVGKPNVGKSTLVNSIVGQQRVVVYDQPGTTRDSIRVPFKQGANQYILIDTAGVRRRKKVSEVIEKFSVIKTLQAIEESNVVLLVLDAEESVTDQDLSLAGYILEAGRAIVLIINKWDKADKDQKEAVKKDIDRKLLFLSFANQHFISALKGTGVNRIYKSIDAAFKAAFIDLSTSKLNKALARAVEKTPPPLVRGRRIKLKFAHQGGKNPPTIIIHGNQVDAIPGHYQRYLNNFLQKEFDLRARLCVFSIARAKIPMPAIRVPAAKKLAQKPKEALENRLVSNANYMY